MELKLLATKDFAEAGADLRLRDPFDNVTELDATIRLVGRDSSRYQSAFHSLMRKRVGKKLSQKESEDLTVELLAECTLDWEGIEENGDSVQFSKAEAKRLYREYPWIREQVEGFIGDRSNFLLEKSSG